MTTAQQYLDKQRSFLGTTGGAPKGNHTIFGEFTHAQNVAWCGSFQLFCAHEVGLVLPGRVKFRTVATRDGFKEYQRADRSGTEPLVGAHVFYDWSGKRDPNNIHHIECVESVLSHRRIITIGGNVDSKVQRVHRSLDPHVVGFGYPEYAADNTPKLVPNLALPTVSLSAVIRAAKRDPGLPGAPQTSPADVRIVETALLAERLFKLSEMKFAHDGSFGTLTKDAYGKWQQRLGFTGADADGIPGTQSLTALGRRHGFRVVA